VSVAGIVDFVVKVGLVAGEADGGRRVAADLLRSIGSLGRVPGLTSYVEIDLGGPVTFGRYSYITDALRLLGSRTLFEDAPSEWLEPDLNAVAAKDPDAIFYEPKMFSGFKEADVGRLLESRGWQRIGAVERGNVFVSPGPLDFLAHHGPSFITEALPWLERNLRAAKARDEH